MKWVVIFLLVPFVCAAQGVKLSRYDNFIKKHRIEMEPTTLLASSDAKLTVTFFSVAADLFLQLKGAGWGATTVDDGNELVFRFANDSSVTVTADGLQTFEPGIPLSTYKHRYRISAQAVQALARQDLNALRKFSFKEATDMRVPRETAVRLQKAASLFLAELNKAAATKPLMPIWVNDVYDHNGDSVQFCSKVYRVAQSKTDSRFTELHLQSNFSQPVVKLLITAGALPTESPEAAFLDKEICVSGVVNLRDNVPTVVVWEKKQLRIKMETGTETLQNHTGQSTPVHNRREPANPAIEENKGQ